MDCTTVGGVAVKSVAHVPRPSPQRLGVRRNFNIRRHKHLPADIVPTNAMIYA